MKLLRIMFLFTLGVSLTSCYERVEGCLDTLSTNFDIASDDTCDDCCIYPAISFQVSHRLGDVKYGFDSIIVNNFGQEVKLNQALFFMSDFKLHTNTGVALTVLEESEYEGIDGEFRNLREDNKLIKQSTSSISIGTIRNNGVIDSISAQAGINHNNIALESDVILYKADSLYQDNQYVDVQLYLKTGDIFEDDIVVKIVNISSNNLFSQSVTPIEKIERLSVGLTLYIDYLDLVKSIDLQGVVDEIKLKEFELPKSFIKFEL